MSTIFTEPPRSKHVLIAEVLAERIRRGEFAVGHILPSEAELSVAFGVSRNTVRIALRNLQGLGLVVSLQGVGTKVLRSQVEGRYTHSFNSVTDLLQYAKSMERRIIDRTQIVLSEAQADFFACKPGEHWWRLRTVRVSSETGLPEAYSEIFVPLLYGPILDSLETSLEPVFSLIEQRFRNPVAQIKQDISAINVNEEEAQHLRLRTHTAGLEIIRRYSDKAGRTVEVARSVHPSGTFKYSMELQLQQGT